ncbi:anaerobic ribonucleoside-triphosphate reductase activating protein [Anaerosacchariphilus polymeriproducens]|uniref:Anaerobic ribonucleoside-triphosphate reductase-activating protein n=1 Tax=Anaerosacchariphilus polymeriproducens TaxID=1812858 RepID=A0A371AZ56_9FIRM|nr:anaerobic ribonucleoside-triphosphate reductase activating protein [Anaerosacchariphilus polymeriproducens]RDU24833.1 anaerobic ribonucleoside-triphosphate reductase activating protein [Anaerosacchariphilus polymeriproducens]
MRYHNITKDDMLNGEGLRVVLWVAGCSHSCKECQNPITWDPNGGLPFDDNAKEELFKELDKDYVSGITLSGGDPLFVENRNKITDLVKEIKRCYPNKTIWMYTGFLWEEISDLEIMNYIDILVDGKYECDKRDTQLHWRGSTNQRVIDVPKSIQNHKKVCSTKA